MKKAIVILTAAISLVSCGIRGGSSGNRERVAIVRVRTLEDKRVTWVRFTEVELNVYKTGDTILINELSHSMSEIKDYSKTLVKIDTIMIPNNHDK